MFRGMLVRGLLTYTQEVLPEVDMYPYPVFPNIVSSKLVVVKLEFPDGIVPDRVGIEMIFSF
jgi:hypothetical protein